MTRGRVLSAAAQLLISAGILGALVWLVGSGPFLAALGALSPFTIGAALLAGTGATIIQAQRWRLVAHGFGIDLGLREAVAKCWQAGFLNSVLPGGLAGDAVRTVDHRSNASWRGGVGSVAGERLAATAVMLGAAAAVLIPREQWAGISLAVVAAGAAVVAWVAMRRLPHAAQLKVAGLSLAGWAVFVALFVVAAGSGHDLATGAGDRALRAPGDTVALAAVTLAGMSLPLGWGGWGPREGAAAFGFALFGYGAGLGVTIAFTYGALALVSVLPGALVLAVRLLRGRCPRGREVELGAGIGAEGEPAGRGSNGAG